MAATAPRPHPAKPSLAPETNGEDGCCGPDAECQREYRGEREAGRLAQLPHREAEVVKGIPQQHR
jgi:hypothetical protein